MRRAGQAAYHCFIPRRFRSVVEESCNNRSLSPYYALQYSPSSLGVGQYSATQRGFVPRYATRRRKLAAGQGGFRICGEQ
jgi:hypothetical protein